MSELIGQDPAATKRITCKKCGEINEYTPSDIITIEAGCDFSNHSWTAQGINCDQCGAEVIIYAD